MAHLIVVGRRYLSDEQARALESRLRIELGVRAIVQPVDAPDGTMPMCYYLEQEENTK